MKGMELVIDGIAPDVAPDAWVAPTAVLAGRVRIAAAASVFYGAVLRGDSEQIEIGAGSNVQDGAVLHADPGHPAVIGAGVSIGHGAVVHGARVEDGSLIGMHATVLNGAVIGAGSLVAAGAVVLEGTVVPPGSLVAGVPAKVRRDLSDAEREGLRRNAEAYLVLAAKHAAATA